MKKLSVFAVLLLLLFTICSISVSALKVEDQGVNITIPDEYTVITQENAAQNDELLKKLNFNENSFKNYLKDNNIVLFAVNGQGDEIVLTANQTEFSSKLVDLSYLDETSLNRVSNELFGMDGSIVGVNEYVFLSKAYSSTDKGGGFSGIQYVTVINSKLYTINFTTSRTTVNSDFAENILKTMRVDSQHKFSVDSLGNIITLVIILIGIFIFIAIAVYIIIAFIGDIKTKRNTSDVAPYVKIKRRKF